MPGDGEARAPAPSAAEPGGPPGAARDGSGEPGPATPARSTTGVQAGATPVREPAPQPLYLAEGLVDGKLQLMRGEEVVLELPSLVPSDGGNRTRAELIAGPEFALILQHRWTQPEPPHYDAGWNGAVRRALLVRRSDLQLLWEQRSGPLAIDSSAFLGTDGLALLHEVDSVTRAERTVIIATDGAEQAIDGIAALSPPDADGWFAARTPAEGPAFAPSYGFARAGTSALRPLSDPLLEPAADAPAFYRDPVVEPDASFGYLSAGAAGQISLVHEHPEAIERIELGSPERGPARVMRGHDSWLVSEPGTAVGSELPWVIVGPDHQPTPVAELPADVRGVERAGADWFALRAGVDWEFAGWLDAATARFQPMPAPPAGMRFFSTESCDSTRQIFADGSVLIGLRDDRRGGLFLYDGAGFDQIGSEIRAANLVAGSRTGETFTLQALDAFPLYYACGTATWEPGDRADGPPLSAGQAEFVRGDHTLRVESGVAAPELDPSGRYAVIPRGDAGAFAVHDLDLGIEYALPPQARVAGWL